MTAAEERELLSWRRFGQALAAIWPEMPTRHDDAFRYLRAEAERSRRFLAHVIEVTTPECEYCEDDAEAVVDHNGEPLLVCQLCADTIAGVAVPSQVESEIP
jgi:hypothetical protein